MRKIFWLVIVAVFAVLAFAVVVFLSREKKPTESGTAVFSDLSSTNYWKKFNFADYDQHNIGRLLRSADLEGKSLLTKEQSERLFQSLEDMLVMNQTGNLDLYHRWRLGVEGSYTASAMRFYRRRFDQANLPAPGTDAELFDAYWKTFNVRRYQEDNYWWTSLVLPATKLTVKKAPPMPESVVQTASKFPNAGVAVQKPSYEEKITPRAVEQKYGAVLIAAFSTIIRDKSGRAYPIYFQTFYSNDDGKWIPWQLALGCPGHGPIDF